MQRNPTEGIAAHPLENDMFKWIYCIKGVAGTPYEGGEYMGMLTFPGDFPALAPSVHMNTPNGRFIPEAKLCIDGITGFHDGSWPGSMSIPSLLLALQSFMLDEHEGGANQAVGYMHASDEVRRQYAKGSKAWNKAWNSTNMTSGAKPPSAIGKKRARAA